MRRLGKTLTISVASAAAVAALALASLAAWWLWSGDGYERAFGRPAPTGFEVIESRAEDRFPDRAERLVLAYGPGSDPAAVVRDLGASPGAGDGFGLLSKPESALPEAYTRTWANGDASLNMRVDREARRIYIEWGTF